MTDTIYECACNHSDMTRTTSLIYIYTCALRLDGSIHVFDKPMTRLLVDLEAASGKLSP